MNKASAYIYYIIKNHPFNDGNKHSGAGSALMFLCVNGIDPKYDKDNFVQFIVGVAEGKINKDAVSKFLQDMD